MLLEFERRPPSDDEFNAYLEFEPQAVMRVFEDVFLGGPPPPPPTPCQGWEGV